jgi:hypothetical protein
MVHHLVGQKIRKEQYCDSTAKVFLFVLLEGLHRHSVNTTPMLVASCDFWLLECLIGHLGMIPYSGFEVRS